MANNKPETAVASTALTVPHYGQGAVAEFGGKLLRTIVLQAAVEDEANKLTAAAGKASQFIGVELTKAIVDLHGREDDLDVFAIGGTPKQVKGLYNQILAGLGVVNRVVKGDHVAFVWVDKDIADLYDYTAISEKTDPAEYNKRFANRTRLNKRLSDACFAACTLVSNKNKPDDLEYQTDPETKETFVALRNAPKEIAGKTKQPVRLVGGGKNKLEGATEMPSLRALSRIGRGVVKPAEKAGHTGTAPAKDGIAMGMSDEDFGRMVNDLIRAINVQEDGLTEQMQQHLRSLQPVVAAALKRKPRKAATK